jgi:hypothetical protein
MAQVVEHLPSKCEALSSTPPNKQNPLLKYENTSYKLTEDVSNHLSNK